MFVAFYCIFVTTAQHKSLVHNAKVVFTIIKKTDTLIVDLLPIDIFNLKLIIRSPEIHGQEMYNS